MTANGVKWVYWGVVICGGIVALLLVNWSRTDPERDSNPQSLKFEPAEIDLREAGISFAGDEIHRTLLLRNATGQPVTIESLSTSCSCSQIAPASGRSLPVDIPGGDELECAVTVEVEATNPPMTLGIEFEAVGRSEQEEQISTTATVSVKGTARLSAEPRVISLGELDSTAEKQTVEVTLLRHEDTEPAGIKSIDTPREKGIRLHAMHMVKDAESDGQGRVPFLRLSVSIDPAKVPDKLSESIDVHLGKGKTLQIPVLGWGAESASD